MRCYDAAYEPVERVAIDATIECNDRLYQLLKKKAHLGIKLIISPLYDIQNVLTANNYTL